MLRFDGTNRSSALPAIPRASSAFALLMIFFAGALLAGCGGGEVNSSPSSGNSGGSGATGGAGSNSNPGFRPSSVNVLTYHYDNLRTGQNPAETFLTPAGVKSATLGKLGSFIVDGKVDAQPLYVSNVNIPGVGARNVLYVVTEHDTVFAFDADSINGNTTASLWQKSMLLSGETPSDDRKCGQVTPEIGITSTPVIDLTRGAIYLIAVSKDAAGNYHHRIHALNLATGAELFGGPTEIAATFPGGGAGSSNGKVVFDASEYNERPGLLELNGTIVTSWGSHCDQGAYTSWVMTYSAATLQQTSVLNLVPNGSDGGIWMSGAAPAADAGNVYIVLGNGTFDTMLTSGFPSSGDCGNCFVKLSPAPLALLDYFTPSNTVGESNGDIDLGSGGPLLLPDLTDASGTVRHLAVTAGKDANIYLVDRDNMGRFNAGADSIYQELNGQLASSEFGKPSYFNNVVYFGAITDALKAFPITAARLASTPSSQSSEKFAYPGTTPSISSNGVLNAIVWAVENQNGTGVLHAYDPANLASEFYNSNQAPNSRDVFADNKFITPMVANGRVYVGTPNSVVVFGLLQ